MKTLSRHLPPAATHHPISVLQVRVTLGICAALFLAALPFPPIRNEMFGFLLSLALFAGVVSIFSKLDHKKFELLMSARVGENICSFRRAFDLQKVDPWIVRAVYEEVRELTGDYPIRASDRFVEELRIESDDAEDIAANVAARAGYDFSDFSANPLAGIVFTVGDLVMFFTHQRCLRS